MSLRSTSENVFQAKEIFRLARNFFALARRFWKTGPRPENLGVGFMRDLIFVSLEAWDEIWRRNQFVCDELARRFPQRRLLFVARPVFVPVVLRALFKSPNLKTLRAAKRALLERFRTVPEHPNICVYTPLRWLPNPIPGAARWNEATMTRGIRRAARKTGVRRPLLWLNPPDSGYLIGQLDERGVVYDITDDWELAAPVGPRRERIAAQDRALCRRADLTVVCSQSLFESRREVARQILLLPNGVNADHYAREGMGDPRPPGRFSPDGMFEATLPEGEKRRRGEEEREPTSPSSPPLLFSSPPLVDWARPVFGYTGSLHVTRIDLELVEELARAFSHGTVVLIGPHFFRDDTFPRALAKHPNIFAPGAVPYAQIADVMAGFDVCIVPHLRSEFVESLNPIKLWEFLACGKPIVAADVAGFRDFPDLVRLAPDAPAFLRACRDALQEVNACASPSSNPAVPCLKSRRQAQARQASWSARVDELLATWRTLGLDGADAKDSPRETVSKAA